MGTTRAYNRHRWYETGTGRYIAADPALTLFPARAGAAAAGFLRGLLGAIPQRQRDERAAQLYTYAYSSPTVWVDPRGLAACPPIGDPACKSPGSGCCIQACMADARSALCEGRGIGFLGDLGGAVAVGGATGILFGPGCGIVAGLATLGVSTALDNTAVAVVAGTKAVFDSCYRNCDPFCPTGGCSPDAIFSAIANGGI